MEGGKRAVCERGTCRVQCTTFCKVIVHCFWGAIVGAPKKMSTRMWPDGGVEGGNCMLTLLCLQCTVLESVQTDNKFLP